jgi:hypothetical protein
MTQFNFTTNIEKRMPDTGKVFCIDRMTSGYAEQHPLDVDGFIESVYQEFAGSEFEESRETLRSIWTAVLSVKSPCGDASLYPNNNGRKRAAAMKVWHKAGDYWRRGFSQGDTLPDMVPMTKITRLDGGGWIALFPKDAHLLSTDITDDTDNIIEPAGNQPEPRQLDLFAFQQLQQENERLQEQIAQMQAQQCAERLQEQIAHMQAQQCAERFCREDSSRRQQSPRRPAQVRRQQPQAATVIVPSASAVGDNHPWLTTAGYLAAASVALLVIWQTGLLIPLGLIGLATSGLLK